MTIRPSAMLKTSVFLAGLSLTAALGLGIAPVSSVNAQQIGGLLEEIIVTARRREENLKDVPVAITALSGDYLIESGVLDQYDLFAEVPGIQYDEARDRLGSRPSIRGVSTTSQNVLLQKSSAFLDGIPLLGNTGSLQFAGVERVEVLRGPQSTAFGRATFAGAVNYVSKDPGNEFSSEVRLATSDLGRNIIGVSLDGPVSDTLGFTFDAYFDEFEGPDEWTSSEGIQLAGTSSDYTTGKLKFTPNDSFDMEVRLMALRTDDGPPIETYISQAERDRCTNFTLPNGQPYISGEFNCDVSSSTPPGGVPQNLHPEETFTPGTPAYYLVQSFSVLDPNSYTIRDRISAEFNVNLDNGSAIQILTSYTEEESRRWFDQDRSGAIPIVRRGMAVGVISMANPMSSDEKYLDLRWQSSDDKAVRWQVGASWFEYAYELEVHAQFAGIVLGLEDEANGGQPFEPGTRRFSEATNTGLYGGVTWDVTDRTTLSFEGRFQDDDVTDINRRTGATFTNVTESFQPRLAINHALDDNWSLYGQASSGTNPAGVNTIFASPNTIASLAAARSAGLITYDETTFREFDEEKLINYEVGIKGGAFDNRLQLTAALYVMDWQDRLQSNGFNWPGTDPDPVTGLCAGIPDCWNDGTRDPNDMIFNTQQTRSGNIPIASGDADLYGVELESSYFLNDNWSFRGSFSIASAEYAPHCDEGPFNDFGFPPTSTVAEGALYDCVDVTGNSLTHEADTTLSLLTTYRAPLGGGDWEWAGRLNIRYANEQFLDPLNLASLPATTQVNGSVTFSDGNWDITLFGNNLTDADTPRWVSYNGDRNINPNQSQDNFWLQLRIPREVGARLSYSF